MNLSIQEGVCFLEYLKHSDLSSFKTDIVIAPSYPSLYPLNELVKKNEIKVSLAAQNIADHKKGPFTGEVSVGMIKEVGCQYVILGHSERRHIYKESNQTIVEKFQLVVESSLHPILCFGEVLSIYQERKTLSFIDEQLKDYSEKQPFVLAYEPVWSIGTGLIPNEKEIADVLAFVKVKFPRSILVYGGSVNAENIHDLASIPFLDGFLVGGASLDPISFLKLLTPLEQS